MTRARIIWSIAFLGVTFTAIVMECIAGLWHPTGWTIPWTEYLARYVPWPIQLVAYVALAVWLPFHFWRHDHMRKVAYNQGRIDMAKAADIRRAVSLEQVTSQQLLDELAVRIVRRADFAPDGR